MDLKNKDKSPSQTCFQHLKSGEEIKETNPHKYFKNQESS